MTDWRDQLWRKCPTCGHLFPPCSDECDRCAHIMDALPAVAEDELAEESRLDAEREAELREEPQS